MHALLARKVSYFPRLLPSKRDIEYYGKTVLKVSENREAPYVPFINVDYCT